jgi:hypothetical protein
VLGHQHGADGQVVLRVVCAEREEEVGRRERGKGREEEEEDWVEGRLVHWVCGVASMGLVYLFDHFDFRGSRFFRVAFRGGLDVVGLTIQHVIQTNEHKLTVLLPLMHFPTPIPFTQPIIPASNTAPASE